MSETALSEPSDREKVLALEEKVRALEHQLDWFKRQLFGRKSERREVEEHPEQPLLNGLHVEAAPARDVEKETITYTRSKQRGTDCATDSGLRFDESVPKKTIRCSAPELEGPHADEYEVVSEKRTYRLAQRPASYVVLEYVRPVLKHRSSQKLSSVPAPPALWSGSLADVSVVAGLLVEKFVYHQPLIASTSAWPVMASRSPAPP